MLYDPLYGICCEIVHPLPHQIFRNNCLEKQCQQKSNRDKYKNLNHIPDQSGEFFYILLRLLQVLLHLLADVTGKHIQRQVAPLPELMDRKKRDIMERKGDKEDENKRQKQQKESSAAAL